MYVNDKYTDICGLFGRRIIKVFFFFFTELSFFSLNILNYFAVCYLRKIVARSEDSWVLSTMWNVKTFFWDGGRRVKVQQFKFEKEKYFVTERNAILDPITFTEIINI